MRLNVASHKFPESQSDNHLKRSSSDESNDEVPHGHNLRATSEPPEIPHLRPTSPSEYSWEWGNFPVKSPGRSKFPAVHPLLSDMARPTARPSMGAKSEPEVPMIRASSEDLGRGFGDGGKLKPDTEDETRFWVDMDQGKRFSFELSMCGPLSGLDTIENAAAFDQHKLTYQELFQDDSLLGNPDLTVRWDEK